MAVIINICSNRKRYKMGYSIANHMSLQEYRNFAERLITKYAYGGFSKAMLDDEDAIDFVAQSIMWATEHWKPEHKCKLASYQISRGKYAIKNWSSRLKSQKYQLSLDCVNKEGGHKFYETVINTDKNKHKEIRHFIYDLLDESKTLTKQESAFLKKKYIDYESPLTLREHFNLTRQRIQQIEKSGIAKLRREFFNEQISN